MPFTSQPYSSERHAAKLRLRALQLPLVASVGILGRTLEVGGRAFAPRPAIGVVLIVVSLFGAMFTLRPFARDIVTRNRAWLDVRRQRAEWARESAVRASRRRIVEARMQYAHGATDAPRRAKDSDGPSGE